MEVLDRYIVDSLRAIAIPNSEFIELSNCKRLVESEGSFAYEVVNKIFMEIEQYDTIVKKILICPEIDKIFREDIHDDALYDKMKEGPFKNTNIWTAEIIVIEGLNEVIFLGDEGLKISFNAYAKKN